MNGRLLKLIRNRCNGTDELAAAAVQSFAIQLCSQSITGQSSKIGNCFGGHLYFFGIGNNGPGQGMFAPGFQRKSSLHQTVFGVAFCG
ncbi:hypothetical protein EVA_13191 [gut metagenome]|uniref:Uncharacterized protein n=1 Tax=gut metagenome TaxID=749906 RepID=J9FUP4_9ZZZZ